MAKGFTVWFTGLSGSGKSTLANRLAKHLRDKGLEVDILDGNVIRRSLSKGLGFSKEDRDENIRRVGHVCSYLTATNRVAIAACISPYSNIRDRNRELIGDFVEVFCNCSVTECAKRDPKGLYAKAFAGEIKGFTGVDDPYESPENAEVTADTENNSIDDNSAKIIQRLEDLGYITREDKLSENEELKIKQKLADLGYL